MPRVVTARQLGLRFANHFGELGPELHLTGHHTAGPVDKSTAHAIALARSYHRAHASKGWGGIGYHYMIARNGTLICLRPTVLKGTHVGGHNSNNVGVVCNGTTGDRPTKAQMKTLRWLIRNAHTTRMPKAHRTDRNLRRARKYGHKNWSGHHSNACPGTHHRFYLSSGHKR